MRMLIAVSMVAIAAAGCSRPGPGVAKPAREAGPVAETTAAGGKAADERRKDMTFLTSRDWMAVESVGDLGTFVDLGTGFRFSEGGRVTDWFRSAELGTFAIDPGQTPKHIDLVIRGESRRCVYETVGGERPEIRLGVPATRDGPRPGKVGAPYLILRPAKGSPE
jgi:hypothetical protein